jgi:hypothetical protein
MNLIDALKINGKATLPNRLPTEYVGKGESGYLRWLCNSPMEGSTVCYDDIMRQDWQPYKEKKEVVIEGIRWEKENTIIIPVSGKGILASEDPKGLLNKPPMKMVLTWEE